MRGVGKPIWHIAGQEPAMDDEWRLLCRFWCHWYQSTSWVHFAAAVYAPPDIAIWALFDSASHKHTPVTFHRLGLVKWMAAAVRLLLFFFFFLLLISAVNIGVRATRPSPQDPPPSAPATASTSVAAMHEAHNLQDVSLLMCVCLSYRAWLVCGATCFDMSACVWACALGLWQPCMKSLIWKLLLVALAQSSKTPIGSHQ